MYIGDEIRRRGLDNSYGSTAYRSNSYPLEPSNQKISIRAAGLKSDDIIQRKQQVKDLSGTQAENFTSIGSAETTDDHIWDAESQNSQSHIVKTTTVTIM